MTTTQTDSNGKPLKGLLAYIYREGTADCSNGGISSRADVVIVVDPRLPQIFTATDECPAVEIGTVEFAAGEPTYHLRPYGEHGKHYMAGGTFIYNSDTRFRNLFPFHGAVAFHDRHEG